VIYIFAHVACICAFQKALSGVFPPIKSAGSECPMRFRPSYMRHFSGLFFFAPARHRLNVLVRRRAPAALSIASPHSCCMGPIMDHIAIWCGYMPPTIGDCFSSPVHQYITSSSSFKESIVFRLGLTCIRVRWGVFTLILKLKPYFSKSTNDAAPLVLPPEL